MALNICQKRIIAIALICTLLDLPGGALAQGTKYDVGSVEGQIGLCKIALSESDKLRGAQRVALIAKNILSMEIVDKSQAKILLECLSLLRREYYYAEDRKRIIDVEKESEARRSEEATAAAEQLSAIDQKRRAKILSKSLEACKVLYFSNEISALTNGHCVGLFLNSEFAIP